MQGSGFPGDFSLRHDEFLPTACGGVELRQNKTATAMGWHEQQRTGRGEVPLHPKGGSLKHARASQFIPSGTRRRRTGAVSHLAAAGLFVLFAVIAYEGTHILTIERLERGVSSQPGQSIENVLGAVSKWKDTSGVATWARRLTLDIVLARSVGDPAAIENALDELVKASPTSAGAWLARAEYYRSLGAPMERVLPGFRMSVLTGSHEGYYMTERVRFGLEQWTHLPEEDRRTVIRDLVGSASEFGPDRYRKIVARKSQAERDEIRAAVEASGRSSERLLQSLGI